MLNYGKPKKIHFPGRKNPSSVYYVRVYDTDTGKRSWVSTHCTSFKAAREWVRTQEMYQAMGKDRLDAEKAIEMTFENAFNQWLSEKEGRISAEKIRSYKSRGETFWLSFFGQVKLREISAEMIKDYIAKRRKGQIRPTGKRKDSVKFRKKKPRKLSPTTVNDDLRDLSGVFNFCVQNDWLTKSPLKGIPKPKAKTRRRIRFLSPEEEARLLSSCKEAHSFVVSAKRNIGSRSGGKVSKKKSKFSQTTPAPTHLHPLVLTALNSGLRKKTLLSLQWKHIDLKKMEWKIPAELLKYPEDYFAPVAQVVIDELRAYRNILLEECNENEISPMDRLGPNAKIFGLSSSTTIRVPFQRAAKKAGLEGLTFHDLRRIYVNKLRNRGVGLEVAMRLSAHKDVGTMMKYYREVQPDELKNAVEVLKSPLQENS